MIAKEIIIENEAKEINQLKYTTLPYYRIYSSLLNESELSKHQIKHFRMLNDLIEMSANNKGIMTSEMYDRLIDNKYNFQVKIINDKPYMKEGYSLVNLMLDCCSSKPISLYMDNTVLYFLEGLSVTLSIYKPS